MLVTGQKQWVLMWVLLLTLLAAGCDTFAIPTVTPTRTLSGPTLEPSPPVFPNPPTELPPDFVDTGRNSPTAAALPNEGALPPLELETPAAPGAAEAILVTALDGGRLSGQLYQSGTTRLPGVLLLAETADSWGALPQALLDGGFTVLAMEMRSAESLDDFNVMMSAISEVGGVSPAQIGVIGAGPGADLALKGCAVDLRCDAVMLLSPTEQTALVLTMSAYNPRPLFLSASEDDPDAFRTVGALRDAATGEVLVQPFTSAGRGLELLVNRPDLGGLMVSWLQRYLPPAG